MRGRWTTVAEFQTAVAVGPEPHWFTPEAMRFFDSHIESSMIGGRFFVTSEQPPDGDRAYSVRIAGDDATVSTLGEFMQHDSLADALAAANDAADAAP